MMSSHEVAHSTFSLERSYPVPVELVFAAWSDPAIKRRWLIPDGDPDHDLDFRVGGHELVRARVNGAAIEFESVYRDIVDNQRIVYSSTLSADRVLSTVSITTVLLEAQGAHTRLTLTEQGTFLDGHEQPQWRERGTAAQLAALATTLDQAD